MSAGSLSPVVVFGAGINGAAVARELALDGCNVLLIDSGDIASGTTAYSSRLIHGGLRYLEYADTALVRESLAERERLLRLAADYVRPLEFRIPVERRLGGFVDAGLRMLSGGRLRTRARRGLWIVRTGLRWYDRLAAGSQLPASRVLSADTLSDAGFSPRFYWLCAYHDAQLRFPEQFTTALVEDARRAAAETGASFEVRTYAKASIAGRTLVVGDIGSEQLSERTPLEVVPAAVINAAGPWCDVVLRNFGVAGPPLIGGTKGSHIVVHRDDLRAALGGAAVYAEARDGRPVFILPFGEATLIGTTDLPYVGDPAEATASEAEIEYLLSLVNDVLPTIRLARDDVTLHYAGVRPLPRVEATTPAAITRRHALVEYNDLPWPTATLVGGKLTTCRALAEEAAAWVAAKRDRNPRRASRDRPVPTLEEAAAPGDSPVDECPRLGDTRWPLQVVRGVIRDRWVRRLEDIVERRLMLLFDRRLTRTTLASLAELMVEAGKLDRLDCDAAVERVVVRLKTHFGRAVAAE